MKRPVFLVVGLALFPEADGTSGPVRIFNRLGVGSLVGSGTYPGPRFGVDQFCVSTREPNPSGRLLAAHVEGAAQRW